MARIWAEKRPSDGRARWQARENFKNLPIQAPKWWSNHTKNKSYYFTYV